MICRGHPARAPDRIRAALEKQFAKWTAAMVEGGKGHNAWPYTTVRSTSSAGP
jgi:hypothetical protein